MASQLKRRQFCFELYTLIIVEEYEVVNEQLRFLYRLRLVPAETLGFQYSKEVFSHGVCVQRRRSCQSQICPAHKYLLSFALLLQIRQFLLFHFVLVGQIQKSFVENYASYSVLIDCRLLNILDSEL